jgi:hypothetical protein
MRPLALLKCIGKAALRQIGNLAGFGLGDVAAELAEEAWQDWDKQKDAAQKRAEMQALVQMAGAQLHEQVAAAVADVAAKQAAQVQQQLAALLQQVPVLARSRFRRPEDQEGRSVPPGFEPRQASDLLPLVSFRSLGPQDPPPRPQVTVEFTAGPHAGERLVFTDLDVLIIGRDKDCRPQIPATKPFNRISRHHCLLDINPPDVRVRDLGSMNGTYTDLVPMKTSQPRKVILLGKRPKGTEPGPEHASPEQDLKDGDAVRLTESGLVTFRVHVRVPPQCSACGAWLAERPAGEGMGLCMSCQAKARPPAVRACAWCHRDVANQAGANRAGIFVCLDCRKNMKEMMQEMIGQAQAGNPDVRAIKDYTLLGELGHGGMGAVHLARHSRTNQAVAIKLMLPEVAADEYAVELFQREIRNTMSLHHRHAVRLLDHGYARGVFFMVLEYCEGGTAQTLLAQRGGRLSIDEAGEIILQALEGLEYTHQAEIPFVRQKGGGYAPGKGLVHRDLKPANLFLTGWGSGRIVKIGDYGLAKAFEESGLSSGTHTGTRAGTWQFICRKQFYSYKRVGPEVDVWAVAASLYYLLTGQTPRDFSDDRDPSLVILEESAVPIKKRNIAIPVKLARVIDAALEEPAMPFETAAAFREALEDSL